MTTLGARAKRARQHLGLRALDVAAALGLEERPATISEIEADRPRTGLKPERLAKLAETLHVSIDWLVTGAPEHAPAWLSAPPTDPPADPPAKPEAAA